MYMFKTLRNKKGMTLTEVIIALAVFGIISVPLIAVFSNSVFITRLTKNQLEINAVIQIVKVEVTQAVKNGNSIKTFEDPDDKVEISPKVPAAAPLYSASGNETTFLLIDESNLNGRYKYKVKYISKWEDSPDILEPEPYTVELMIELYSDSGKLLKELKADIQYDK